MYNDIGANIHAIILVRLLLAYQFSKIESRRIFYIQTRAAPPIRFALANLNIPSQV